MDSNSFVFISFYNFFQNLFEHVNNYGVFGVLCNLHKNKTTCMTWFIRRVKFKQIESYGNNTDWKDNLFYYDILTF